MTDGFFSSAELAKQPKKRVRKIPGCGACGLHKDVKSPKMKLRGKGRKRILLVFESPSSSSDIEGMPFAGKDGKYLRRCLKAEGIDMAEDCWRIHAVNCKIPKRNKKKASSIEVEHCRPMLLQAIEKHKPKIILLFGSTTILSFLGHRWKKGPGSINKWHGYIIPDRVVKAWVCPLFHPSYVRGMSKSKYKKQGNVAEVIFKRELHKALKKRKKKFPKYPDVNQYIELLYDSNKIERFLKGLLKREPKTAIDFETTGLKPHRKGHKILSCAICDSPTHSVAFPVKKKNVKTLRRVLHSRKIKKIGAIMKFEMSWAWAILNCTIRGWIGDVVVRAHVLDNRRGNTSVKFQTYVYFGISGYDDHVDEFKKGIKEKDGNSFNRMEEVGLEDLLTYNAFDSLYEYWIDEVQEKKIRRLCK